MILIKLAITKAAYDAVAATLPRKLRQAPELTADGRIVVRLPKSAIQQLKALRR
jgi:hypothetical protein